MKPGEELMERFFSGDCTPAEAKKVMDWLLRNDQVNLWEADWQQVAGEGEYPAHLKGAMLDTIYSATYGKVTPVRRIGWKHVAVAASVLIAVGLFYWHPSQKPTHSDIAGITTKSTPIAHWMLAVNDGDKARLFTLSDGSLMTLEPGARLQYDSVAYATQRDLYLQGQAQFHVHASASKPFNVHTGSFTTAALGTTFSVAAQQGNLQVKLFAGKVVVKQNGQAHYLRPGEALQYDSLQQHFTITHFTNTAASAATNTSLGITVSEDTVVFVNTPLKNVLQLLEQQYHVPIRYGSAAVKQVYFSGKILPETDTLDTILQTIARLNNLTVMTEGQGYVIQ